MHILFYSSHGFCSSFGALSILLKLSPLLLGLGLIFCSTSSIIQEERERERGVPKEKRDFFSFLLLVSIAQRGGLVKGKRGGYAIETRDLHPIFGPTNIKLGDHLLGQDLSWASTLVQSSIRT